MTPGLAEPTLAAIVVAQITSSDMPNTNASGAPASTEPATTEPKKVAANAGSLGQPATAAVKNAGLNGAVAIGELPLRRVGAIVRTAERGAIQRMEQRAPVRVVVPNIRVPQGNSGGETSKLRVPCSLLTVSA